jgi:DNA repair exonuclease SbcCD ATPase subunit
MIKDLRNAHERRKGELSRIQTQVDDLETKLKTGRKSLIRHERALEIVKQVGLATQKQLEYHLAEQVSLAMEAVFDDPYQLKVDFQEKRGKTEVGLLFKRGELECPPIGNTGGGAIDIAALALRIAYWAMRQDKKVRPVLLLDEPFSRLKGEDANRRALAILQEISDKLRLQIIMVSDERMPREDIIDNANQVFLVSQKSGVSQIEIVKGNRQNQGREERSQTHRVAQNSGRAPEEAPQIAI